MKNTAKVERTMVRIVKAETELRKSFEEGLDTLRPGTIKYIIEDIEQELNFLKKKAYEKAIAEVEEIRGVKNEI